MIEETTPPEPEIKEQPTIPIEDDPIQLGNSSDDKDMLLPDVEDNPAQQGTTMADIVKAMKEKKAAATGGDPAKEITTPPEELAKPGTTEEVSSNLLDASKQINKAAENLNDAAKIESLSAAEYRDEALQWIETVEAVLDIGACYLLPYAEESDFAFTERERNRMATPLARVLKRRQINSQTDPMIGLIIAVILILGHKFMKYQKVKLPERKHKAELAASEKQAWLERKAKEIQEGNVKTPKEYRDAPIQKTKKPASSKAQPVKEKRYRATPAEMAARRQLKADIEAENERKQAANNDNAGT